MRNKVKHWLEAEFMSEKISLVWMILPVSYMLSKPPTPEWAGYVLFMIYFVSAWHSIRREENRQLYIGLQIVAIALLGYLGSPIYFLYGSYPVAAIGLLRQTRQITTAVVWMIILFSISGAMYFRDIRDVRMLFWLVPTFAVLIILPYTSLAHRKAKELKKQLDEANKQFIQNEERQRIARDLHDSLGHTLTFLTVRSELAERLIPVDRDRAVHEVKEIQADLRLMLKQVRELVGDMKTTDIPKEIRKAEQLLGAIGIDFRVAGDKGITILPPDIQNILGICLRECIANIIKHSGAKQCDVRFNVTDTETLLMIEDNGIGTNPNFKAVETFGTGLSGLKDRLAPIGGKVTVSGSYGAGTKVIICVPNGSVAKQRWDDR